MGVWRRTSARSCPGGYPCPVGSGRATIESIAGLRKSRGASVACLPRVKVRRSRAAVPSRRTRDRPRDFCRSALALFPRGVPAQVPTYPSRELRAQWVRPVPPSIARHQSRLTPSSLCEFAAPANDRAPSPDEQPRLNQRGVLYQDRQATSMSHFGQRRALADVAASSKRHRRTAARAWPPPECRSANDDGIMTAFSASTRLRLFRFRPAKMYDIPAMWALTPASTPNW